MAKTERRELCRQVLETLSSQGIELSGEALELMEPLLDGRMDYAEHRAWLESMANEPELVDEQA